MRPSFPAMVVMVMGLSMLIASRPACSQPPDRDSVPTDPGQLIPARPLQPVPLQPAPLQPPPRPETEVEKLRRQVAEQEERIKFLNEMVNGVGTQGQAIRAPFGRFLLIKKGPHCLALQITEHRDVEKGTQSTTKYRWFLQSDGSLDFAKPNLTQGQGELCEFRDGRNNGRDFIRVGPFDLEWSSGDWIYFPTLDAPTPQGAGPGQPNKDQEGAAQTQTQPQAIQMASTELVRPEDILTQSPTLHWNLAPKPRPRREPDVVINSPRVFLR